MEVQLRHGPKSADDPSDVHPVEHPRTRRGTLSPSGNLPPEDLPRLSSLPWEFSSKRSSCSSEIERRSHKPPPEGLDEVMGSVSASSWLWVGGQRFGPGRTLWTC